MSSRSMRVGKGWARSGPIKLDFVSVRTIKGRSTSFNMLVRARVRTRARSLSYRAARSSAPPSWFSQCRLQQRERMEGRCASCLPDAMSPRAVTGTWASHSRAIHGVCLAVEQAEQTHPKHDALVAVPGCTARSAVARTRRHVARRAPGGSILRRAPGVRWQTWQVFNEAIYVLLVVVLATQLGMVQGLRCYTYRSIHDDCSKFSPGVFSAGDQLSQQRCESLGGYGIATGLSPLFCVWRQGTLYGGVCEGSMESPVTLSSDAVKQTCSPGQNCFRSVEMWRKQEEQPDAPPHFDLNAGCAIFSINCTKTHFTWAPKMYCGECITVRHKVLELEF